MFRTKSTAAAKGRSFKKTLDGDEQRRKREDTTVSLRRNQREESMMKRRMRKSEEPAEGLGQLAEQSSNRALTQDEVASHLGNMPGMVASVMCDDGARQLEATTCFRKLLSVERNPPIQKVIDAGVVPRLVQFLSFPNPTLQFEAAWTLTNIASGSSQHTEHVIQQGAVPQFVCLLRSPNPDVAEQAVWALGNIAGDSTQCRDFLLREGTMNGLLQLIKPDAKVTLLRNVTWAMSNLCRGKPRPDFSMIRPCLPALQHLLNSTDEEVITDAAWALSYVSDDNAPDNCQIQGVCDQPGLVARLTHLLAHHSNKIQTPCLRTIGNIVTGDDRQTQLVVENSALPNVLNMMSNAKKGIRKEAAWTISNITAGSPNQIQSVIQANLIPPLVNMLANAEFDVQKEAAWALSNACSGGAHQQIEFMVSQGLIHPMCQLMTCADPKIVMVALDGLDAILKSGKANAGLGDNKFADHVEECSGLDLLEELQRHDNEEVYEKAIHILRSYFESEEDDDDVQNAPAVNNNQFVFGAAAPAVTGGFNFA